jgi:hypothetical protein
MRNFRNYIVLCMMLIIAMPSQAKVKFGLKGGLNVTNFSLNSDVFDASNRAGFYVGPTLLVQLPIVGLGVDGSVLYDQRSGKVESSGTEETIDAKSIAIPLNLRYNIGLSSLASIFFFAGPQFDFNVGDDYDDINWKWKDSNISINLGAGLMLASHLQINANYNIQCGKTGEFEASDAFGKGKMHSWQIGLAYYF